MTLILGDCLEKLKELEADSIDAIVTDPPYGLSFMGKKWDYSVPSVDVWREVLRVLKPGGHLLSFGGTRTYHRMVVNIEDAGFEVRDQIMWIYGSGFPKSLAIDKAIDKQNGDARPVVGAARSGASSRAFQSEALTTAGTHEITSAASAASAAWSGWGTALKPANEPIVLARKPLSEATVAKNVLRWGTGAINVDASRIGMLPATTYTAPDITGDAFNSDVSKRERKIVSVPAQGRWPANVLFNESAAEMLDEQSGHLKNGGNNYLGPTGESKFGNTTVVKQTQYAGDSGGASRFFYVAKCSKRERNAGLDGGNNHPTVKPIKLMEYLCRLVTPPSGTILDPFMGSGSTGCAAVKLGFNFIGVEREAEYLEIAKRRITHWQSETEMDQAEDKAQLEMQLANS